jgi:hypothetical protein
MMVRRAQRWFSGAVIIKEAKPLGAQYFVANRARIA